mgnify:CR=1 FL=1
MNDKLTQTVRIMRPSRVTTDDRGRTVWDGPVEETELELVSTQMLKSLLDSGDRQRRQELADAAKSKEGVLARNLTSGTFEIIDDDDLKAALASADATPGKARAADVTLEPIPKKSGDTEEELSLVSTQALRKILGHEVPAAPDEKDEDDGPAFRGGGFDPYNHG